MARNRDCPSCGVSSGTEHKTNCPALRPRHEAVAEASAARAAAVKSAAEKKDRAEKRLRGAVDAVLKTEPGRVLWAHLFQVCGYNITSLEHRTDGELAPLATEAREAQRLIYIRLRSLPSRALREAAEIFAESETESTQEK